MKSSLERNSQEKIDHIREEFNVMCQVAAYHPPIRRGQQVNRRELKMQRTASSMIYSKRSSLARNIVIQNREFLENNPEFSIPGLEDRKAILNKAMIASKLSPVTNMGWIDYMLVLSDEYGGWSNLIHALELEVNKEDYFSRTIKNNIIFALCCVLLVLSIPFNSVLHGYKFVVVDSFALLAYLLCFYSCIEPYKKRKEMVEPKRLETSERIKTSDVNFLKKSRDIV